MLIQDAFTFTSAGQIAEADALASFWNRLSNPGKGNKTRKMYSRG
jgi:hypothetical protein